MFVKSLFLEAAGPSPDGSYHAQLVLRVGPAVSVVTVPWNGPYTPNGPINVTSADLAAALNDLAAALPTIASSLA